MKHLELILAAALCAPFFAENTLNAAATAPREAAKKSEAAWLTDFEAAKNQAAKENKPILMFFTGSDWCSWCQKLQKDVLEKDEFKEFAKSNVILLELDFPNDKSKQSDELQKQNAALGRKFKINGYPTMVLVASNGEKEIDRVVGYSADMVDKLKASLKTGSSAKKTADKSAGANGQDDLWLTDLEEAKKRAAKENKPILMFFTGSDWCIWCQRLEADVLEKDEFRQFAKANMVLLEIDFPNDKSKQSGELKKQNAELDKKFKVEGYPTMVLVASDGETELDREVGYSKELVTNLKTALKKTKASVKKKLPKKPEWK